jgi:diguanylate cyclase (GGDEF)-like protein
MTTIDNKPRHLYVRVIFAWIILVVIISCFVIKSNIDSAKDAFNSQTAALYNLIDEKVKINETVAESFAATVSTLGAQDYERFRVYAKQMSARYPHIFMFEIVEKILNKDKDDFEDYFQNNIFRDFNIKTFSYETDRKWEELKDKEYYMPITFMEPFLPGSQKVLGLDVSSNTFLVESLQSSVETHSSVSTRPFTLVEGELAYLIYKPIIKHGVNVNEHDHSYNLENRYAILVILVESLFRDKQIYRPNHAVTLYHSDFRANESDGTLYYQEGSEVGALESLVFPKLIFNQKLDNESQPFILLVEQKIGWDILNWWLLLIIFIVATIAFFIMLRYAKTYHHLEILRKQETENLFYLANHDSLTGLSNRNLMLDRFRHALTQAERSKTSLAVLFMDLDGFKIINDTYGHATGDKVLQSAAERLLACIRRGDTLARQSGDEFVLILENIHGKVIADEIVEKIKSAFEQSFRIEGNKINVGISIGVAVYPDDATTEYELIELADRNMYQNKKK